MLEFIKDNPTGFYFCLGILIILTVFLVGHIISWIMDFKKTRLQEVIKLEKIKMQEKVILGLKEKLELKLSTEDLVKFFDKEK